MMSRAPARFRVLAALLALALSALFLFGCWFIPLSIDESADGSIQTIRIGDTIRIVLAGNASTGYQWIRVEPDSLVGTVLESIEEGTYEQDDAHVCGGPGTFTFRYEAVASGTIELVYAYAKPWEGDPVDTVSVIVWVE